MVKLDPAEMLSCWRRYSTFHCRRARLASGTRGIAAPAIGGADKLGDCRAPRAQPVVLALEDLHWADPTTLDVLRGIAERGAQAPLFVVATTRPEFRPPWGMRSHHGTISLAPLDRAQVPRHGGGAFGAPCATAATWWMT